MIEYRITTHNDKILPEMGKDNRQLIQILEGKMYWSRTIKQTRTVKTKEETPEFIEFITAFRKINNNGSYADTLINKYTDVLKEISHKDMMEKLEEYRKHLEAFTKNPLQVGTFLNQKRYLDTYEIVKVNYEDKWIDDIIKERNLDQFTTESVMQEVKKWKDTHSKTREFTSVILDNIILKYLTN